MFDNYDDNLRNDEWTIGKIQINYIQRVNDCQEMKIDPNDRNTFRELKLIHFKFLTYQLITWLYCVVGFKPYRLTLMNVKI